MTDTLYIEDSFDESEDSKAYDKWTRRIAIAEKKYQSYHDLVDEIRKYIKTTVSATEVTYFGHLLRR